MSESVHQTRGTTVDNTSQECCAMQCGETACTSLGAANKALLIKLRLILQRGSYHTEKQGSFLSTEEVSIFNILIRP